jgi:RNA polymerase primary sigma factor
MSLKNTSHWVNQKEIQGHTVEMKKHAPLTKDQETVLLNRIKAGDVNAKHKLILANMRFVLTVAKKYQNKGLSLNDLISEGNLGLAKAADRYDYETQPVRFLSYAVWWIRQSMTEALHNNGRTIRIPANIIGEVYRSANQPLSDTMHDYAPTFPKIISFDMSIDEDGATLHEMVPDQGSKTPYEEMDNVTTNMRASLTKILSLLKRKEEIVISKSFGLYGEAWTLQDIADDMGLTKERVRQIKEKGLKKLRANATNLLELVA